jgi:hypothetical protein
MSHHARLEKVLGHLRNLNLTDVEVEAAMMPLNHIVAGYGPIASIRVAHPENPAEVEAYLRKRGEDFGPTCIATDDAVAVGQDRVKLILVGYHHEVK